MQSDQQHHADATAVLTIAGSDSAGGAGIQADLKTFEALGISGHAAVTSHATQQTDGSYTVNSVQPENILDQISAICRDHRLGAAKTGMLCSAEIIRAVAAEDTGMAIPVWVVDPVLISSSGVRLIDDTTMSALKNELFPKARVITPSIREAELIYGRPISSPAEIKQAAPELGQQYDVACVIKGGQMPGDQVVDFLYDEGEEYEFTSDRIRTSQTHGAGCVFSAALTVGLARHELISEAVRKAKLYVYHALRSARDRGLHHPLDFQWTRHEMADT